MSRFTSSYSEFVARLSEIDTLCKLAGERERKAPILLRAEINALVRGAIVLLCANLEAYIKELGELSLESLDVKNVSRAKLSPRFYYFLSQDKIKEIKDANEQKIIAERIFDFMERDRDLWSRTGAFPRSLEADRFNGGFSNPTFEKIKAYLGRFDYSSYKNDLQARLKANYNSTITTINHLVEIRNKIAHGDASATKTPSEVKNMIAVVRQFCLATDSVFAGWWGKHYCSIR